MAKTLLLARKVLKPLWATFHYAVAAYVALWCTIDDLGEGQEVAGLIARLRAIDRETLRQWLDMA